MTDQDWRDVEEHLARCAFCRLRMGLIVNHAIEEAERK